MQIIIDKETLVQMLKVSLYAITGADYTEIGEAVTELLDKVGYVEIPENHGDYVLPVDHKETTAPAPANLTEEEQKIIKDYYAMISERSHIHKGGSE